MVDFAEGMRERKKRLMRQLISDTATQMFLERGFDNVKVSEVAAECDVSEKTVYNYFPTKEELVLDREEGMIVKIKEALGPNATKPPIDAMLELVEADIDNMYEFWEALDDPSAGFAFLLRFRKMIEETPSLQAASRASNERMAQVAAAALAERAGVHADDPEPQIAGNQLVSLWTVYWHTGKRFTNDVSAEEVRDKSKDDLHRAARFINAGLWTFNTALTGTGRFRGRELAEPAMKDARKVATALKKAQRTEVDEPADEQADLGDFVKSEMSKRRDEIRAFREQMRADKRDLRDEIKRRKG